VVVTRYTPIGRKGGLPDEIGAKAVNLRAERAFFEI